MKPIPHGGFGYFDRNGERITFSEYARLIENREYARVELTRVGDVEVSTVWLGIDHRFGREPIAIFASMVFDVDAAGERTRAHDDQWRYSTEAEARLGHAALVAKMRGVS